MDQGLEHAWTGRWPGGAPCTRSSTAAGWARASPAAAAAGCTPGRRSTAHGRRAPCQALMPLAPLAPRADRYAPRAGQAARARPGSEPMPPAPVLAWDPANWLRHTRSDACKTLSMHAALPARVENNNQLRRHPAEPAARLWVPGGAPGACVCGPAGPSGADAAAAAPAAPGRSSASGRMTAYHLCMLTQQHGAAHSHCKPVSSHVTVRRMELPVNFAPAVLNGLYAARA